MRYRAPLTQFALNLWLAPLHCPGPIPIPVPVQIPIPVQQGSRGTIDARLPSVTSSIHPSPHHSHSLSLSHTPPQPQPCAFLHPVCLPATRAAIPPQNTVQHQTSPDSRLSLHPTKYSAFAITDAFTIRIRIPRIHLLTLRHSSRGLPLNYNPQDLPQGNRNPRLSAAAIAPRSPRYCLRVFTSTAHTITVILTTTPSNCDSRVAYPSPTRLLPVLKESFLSAARLELASRLRRAPPPAFFHLPSQHLQDHFLAFPELASNHGGQ